jgi:hypothetical protein
VERHEVPSIVVGGLSLRDLDVGFGLDGVDEVDKLDGVLDEEDGDVVSDCLVRSEQGKEAENLPRSQFPSSE